MATYRNGQGDVLNVPDALGAFLELRGYTRIDAEPTPEPVVAAPPPAPAAPAGDSETGPMEAPASPAAPTPDPAAGDNDSEGVTNNG